MIAITVSENIKNAKIEDCFGKSEYFFIIDKQTKESYFEKNPAKELLKNSGREAALFLIKKGVKTVISANFGVPVKKLFDKIGPTMKEREGGYTRIYKLGWRQGDGAPLSLIELVTYVSPEEEKKSALKKAKQALEKVKPKKKEEAQKPKERGVKKEEKKEKAHQEEKKEKSKKKSQEE